MAYEDSLNFDRRPADGTRLDQILADLKARARPAPAARDIEPARNVTPLNTPFRAEILSLQASIDQLADKVDTQRLAEAIADLSDKVATLHADRSLGEAEMRLLRSIRRSLDDLIYQMSLPQEPGVGTSKQADDPRSDSEDAAPIFGRRQARPVPERVRPAAIATPRLEPAQRRPLMPRALPWNDVIRRYPLASVAAAAVVAIVIAQNMTAFAPRVGDITGTIRAKVSSPAKPTAGSADALPAPATPAPARLDSPATTPAASAPAMPAPIATPPQMAATRPLEEVSGLAAYQAAIRLADGPARDMRGAIQLFEKAGDMPAAQFRLALLYERGQGSPKNPALARSLYQRAAERGHVRAMHNLGVLYADGIDSKPDYATAAEWFRRAADYGLRDSEYNLATLTARGLGVPKNPAAAYTWFALAAAQGDGDAARQRDEIGKTMDATTLKSAKLAADNFRPKPIDPVVNQTAGTP